MNYRVDLAVLSDENKVSRFGMTLHNLSDQALTDWTLHFAVDRYILPETLTQGSIKQIGGYCQLTPENQQTLEANNLYYVEFDINTVPFRFLTDGINDAFIEVNTSSDSQRISVDITPITLASPYKERIHVPTVSSAELSLIPQPLFLERSEGRFILTPDVGINRQSELANVGVNWLIGEIEKNADISLCESETGKITYRSNPTLDEGCYNLTISPNRIIVESGSSNGFVHASATLLQIISGQQINLVLPCLSIKDKPRYRYRGMMLDCARHFHSVEQVKSLINHLASYKFNHFHWHLTDDEGWRIEIKAFPELTQIGAWRGLDTPIEPQYSHIDSTYGGFYTQEDIADVVQYALDRGVTVIPEIDIPGHCRAAIKSLPNLLVDPEDKSEYRSIQYYNDNVLSPALPGTYQFVDTVLEEIAALFPAPYIHIGADEVPKGVWTKSPSCQALMEQHGYEEPSELQGHLLRHAEQKLKSLGKRMLGWEEAQHGDKVSKDTVIFSWLSEEAALTCAQKGFDVVLQPGQSTYLDMTQDFAPEEHGVDWANPIPLERAYRYEPLDALAENDPIRNRVWGVQCALWCEIIENQSQLEYMVFPRITAMAEVNWSDKSRRDWLDYLARLQAHLNHLDRQGVNYRNPWQQ